MFKKPVELQSRLVLKARVLDAIKRQLVDAFPALTTDDLATLFPPKCSVTQDTLSAPVKCTVIHTDKHRPLFVNTATNAKQANDWLPTVYALWLVPHLLHAVYVPPAVTQYLISGADLMLPGVLTPLGGYQPPFAKGERRCVIARGNPMPVAVGEMCVDETHVRFKGMIGRGMRLLHCFGDSLYQSGDQSIPNVGFKPQQVHAVLTAQDVVCALEEHRAAGNEAQVAEITVAMERLNEQRESNKPSAVTEANQPVTDSKVDEASDKLIDANLITSTASQSHNNSVTTFANEIESTPAPAPASAFADSGPTPAEMDAMLVESLKFAIKTKLSDDMFPLTPSVLLSSHMEACNPCFHRLSLQRSSYKKLSKFLKEIQKMGFLHLKQKQEEIVVMGVYYDHPDMKEVKVTKEYSQALKAKAKRLAQSSTDADTTDTADPFSKADRELQILLRYRLPSSLRFLLSNRPTAELMEMKDAKALLWQYTQREQLDRGSSVAVNPLLAQSLSLPTNASTVSKSELSKRFESSLLLYHAIVTQSNADIDKVAYQKGPVPAITVSIEHRAGKKTMSVIEHLELFGIDLPAFARLAQKWWAASATVGESTSGKQVHRTVLVQGSVMHDIVQRLHDEFGIPAYCVHLQQPKKK